MERIKVVVKWKGDDPNPKDVLGFLESERVKKEGMILDPCYSQDLDESHIIYTTNDPLDTMRFIGGIFIQFCKKQAAGDLSRIFEINLGRPNFRKLEESNIQLESIVRNASRSLKNGTMSRIFPWRTVEKVRKSLEESLKNYRLASN